MTMSTLLLCVVFMCVISTACASLGDRSHVFVTCLGECHQMNCTSYRIRKFSEQQPYLHRLLRWSCDDECEYQCMWSAVGWFQKTGWDIPQFRGKWPFVRFLGMQEPASVLFSLLNGLPHLVMLPVFRKHVPDSAPLYYLVHGYAAVCLNTWFWSAVFHARDTPLTEKLDYFCATSFILYSAWTFCVRFIRTDSVLPPVTCAAVLISWFVYHVHYLTFVHFDYGYNMKASVIWGIFNSTCWITLWLWERQNYAWKGAITIIIANLLLALELGDFAPIWWIFDAHSLWHGGTAPLPFLYYSFLIDDCLHLHKKKQKVNREKMG